MAMQRFTNPRLPVMLTGSLLVLYACSFQDFDHLQGGSAGTGKGGTSSGGTSGSANGSGSGGDVGTGGSAAGTESAGGSSGDAGSTGEAGIGGQSDGGAPAGGTSSAGTAGGGTGGAVAGGGDAGEPSDAGGDGGLGGSGGSSGSGGVGGLGGGGGSGGSPPVGNLLVNPGFQSGLAGWTVDPPTATTAPTRYAYTQTPNPANGTGSSLATWHQTDEYSVSVFQNVTGLVPGAYTFKGFLSSLLTREAYLFARNCGGAEITSTITPVSYEWFEVSIPSIPVSGTSCEVGIFVHNVGADWVNADEFSFEKDP
jgi:hypothetical protein